MKGFRKPFLNKQIAICTLALFGETAAMAKDAPEIFRVLCTPCHGMNGEGKKPMGPPLKGSEFIKTSSDADVKKTIQNGRAGTEKKFKDLLGKDWQEIPPDYFKRIDTAKLKGKKKDEETPDYWKTFYMGELLKKNMTDMCRHSEIS